jgi:serine/threonine protein kinase
MTGRTLGHYRIESELGAGGMGVVYRARDTKLERTVAIKLVGERLSEEPTARDRLLREARTASALNHPHICTVHEVGEADGQVYIVMEHVEGRPLSSLLAEPRPMDTVVRYGIQIADALAHAHDHGIVHRDLKTGNVIVTPEGRIKVLDFGLAKRLPAEDPSEQETRSDDSLTQAGQVVGTLHYLAPESLRGKPADARTDIWALGVLLYELACGSLPFQGSTRFEVTHAILGEAPAPLPPSVPPALAAVIQRCLAKEPGERYQRAGEVRAVLEALRSGSASLPGRASTSWVRRWAMWAAPGATLLLGAIGTYQWIRGEGREIHSMAVLPFVNQGGDPENEYLSDGIAESVIGSLSRLPKLKMIAFGSVLRYKGRPVDAGMVARELGVAAMVVGRVTPHRDGLLISAELIDTRDGSRLWGDQYEAKPGAFLSVQQEISRQITEQLRSRLTREQQGRVARRYTGDAEAYELGGHRRDAASLPSKRGRRVGGSARAGLQGFRLRARGAKAEPGDPRPSEGEGQGALRLALLLCRGLREAGREGPGLRLAGQSGRGALALADRHQDRPGLRQPALRSAVRGAHEEDRPAVSPPRVYSGPRGAR